MFFVLKAWFIFTNVIVNLLVLFKWAAFVLSYCFIAVRRKKLKSCLSSELKSWYLFLCPCATFHRYGWGSNSSWSVQVSVGKSKVSVEVQKGLQYYWLGAICCCLEGISREEKEKGINQIGLMDSLSVSTSASVHPLSLSACSITLSSGLSEAPGLTL